MLCLLLGLTVTACREVTYSDEPVDREAVMLALDRPLPMPKSASNIQFYLAGETQNWDFYLAFDAPSADMDLTLAQEGLEFLKDQEGVRNPGRIVRQTISSENLPPETLKDAPRWWTPQKIKNGYFVGSTISWDGPHYWVDTDTGRIFYYTHW